jgi:hypothetical protein
LYEPSSPASLLWKEKAFDVPPSPMSPVGIFNSREQRSSLSPSRDLSVHEPLREPEPATETETHSRVSSSERNPHVDDDATPRPLSPS